MVPTLILSAALSFLVQPLSTPSTRSGGSVVTTECRLVPAVVSTFGKFSARVHAARMAVTVGSEEDIAQVVRDADAVFAVIDVNGDGSIDRSELMTHLTKAGYTENAVNMLFDKLDEDGSESIDRDELRAGFLKYTPLRKAPGLGAYNTEFVKEIHADADSLFAALDKNNDGAISKAELREHLKTFHDYSFKAISNIFKTIDFNGDGEIELEELRDAFVTNSALRQAIGEGPNFK